MKCLETTNSLHVRHLAGVPLPDRLVELAGGIERCRAHAGERSHAPLGALPPALVHTALHPALPTTITSNRVFRDAAQHHAVGGWRTALSDHVASRNTLEERALRL